PARRWMGKKNHDLPPTARSNRLSPSVTMSRPAASWALMIQATASRYCSRKMVSPSAALKDRPWRLSVNQIGRGYDPVIAVGMMRLLVTLSILASLGSGLTSYLGSLATQRASSQEP